MSWASLARRFGRHRGADAQNMLSKAYRNVFIGNATREEAQTVLVDLANHSGFYKVLPPGATKGDLSEANGKRAVFGRVFRFLNMSDEEIRGLEEAARLEALTDATEGEI